MPGARSWWAFRSSGLAALLLLSRHSETAGQVQFTDVTEAAGMGIVAFSAKPSWADYDGDGDQDLFVTELQRDRGNFLWQNQGDGTFQDVAASAGLDAPSLPVSAAAWADYDNDGGLDVYITTSSESSDRLFGNGGNGTFTDVTVEAGVWEVRPRAGLRLAWGDYDRDGWVDLFVANADLGEEDYLYYNNRDGSFTELSASLGVGTRSWNAGTEWGDYDADGWPDLVVCVLPTYFPPEPALLLYHNEAGGGFSEVSQSVGLRDLDETDAASWGDFDNDGDLDLFVLRNDPFHFDPDRLFRNTGEGTFADVSEEAGFTEDLSRLGAHWGDYDNDGDLDIFLRHFERWFLYRNEADGTFSEVASEVGLAAPESAGWAGAAWADYDNDGDLDLFVTRFGEGPSLLFQNEGTGKHFLTVTPRGRLSNRAGIGAKVHLFGRWGRMFREVHSGEGLGSMSDMRAHFGLGSVATVDSLVIRWPSGVVDVEREVAADQFLTCVEDSGCFGVPVGTEDTPPRPGTPLPRAWALGANFPNPFNPSTTIPYTIPGEEGQPVAVRLEVFSLRGEDIRTLVDSPQEPGWHQVVWDGRDEEGRLVPSGAYLIRLHGGQSVVLRKSLLVR